MTKRLYSPNYVREIVEDYGFKFSKSLGQNFLIDGNIVRNIREAAGIGPEDYVLEIGPGIGTLTEELALSGKKVVSVEIDDSLIPILDETLEDYDNIEIVNKDILEVDIDRLIEEKLDGARVKLVANLPYYVTTPIIGKLIEGNYNIDSITVMVQREIAERMVAGPGSRTYGALSVFINYYTNPSIEFIVPSTVFIPQPKVESAVIKLKMKEDLPHIDKKVFFELVRGSFATRRKTIVNSLSNYGIFDMKKPKIREIVEASPVDSRSRAEDLSIEDFIGLAGEFLKHI